MHFPFGTMRNLSVFFWRRTFWIFFNCSSCMRVCFHHIFSTNCGLVLWTPTVDPFESPFRKGNLFDLFYLEYFI